MNGTVRSPHQDEARRGPHTLSQDEDVLDPLDRLVTQELDRVQKGGQDEALKKDQASRE
jgi:hypothetical protein